MKKIMPILVLFIIVAVTGISGCISFGSFVDIYNDFHIELVKHTVGNSTFQIPDDWDIDKDIAVGNKLFNISETLFHWRGSDSLSLNVVQYSNEDEFNFYRLPVNKYNIIDISGVNVIYIYEYRDNPDWPDSATYYYYFQKNNKHYEIEINDCRIEKNDPDEKFLNDTAKTIITTIR